MILSDFHSNSIANDIVVADKVADVEVDMVTDMEVDMVSKMEVDNVADMG